MIIWGGFSNNFNLLNSGARYNPMTDLWTVTSTTGAPSMRLNHTAVWTGTEMIVWGGVSGGTTGGRYNPATDSWVATSTTNAPVGRENHTAIWTGNEMIVWGGENPGGRYTTPTIIINSTSQYFTVVGGSGSFILTAQGGCDWAVTSNADWLTVISGSSGSGNGTVNYSVAPNTDINERTGTLTIAGQTFTVIQDGINNPVPILASFNPNSAIPGGAGFTLTIAGDKFTPNSVVRWNGAARETTFVSRTRLQAAITAADVAAPGMFSVAVFNPAPGGGTSDALTFSTCTYSISPTYENFEAIGGSGVVAVLTDSACSWTARSNNSFISITSGSSGTGSGIVNYFVSPYQNPNPRTGSMTIAGRTFSVFYGAILTPTVNNLSPSSIAPGSPGFTLTVNGSNFFDDCVVLWNGSERTTTFVSQTRLTAAITAADIATLGLARVTVFNPHDFGGGESTPLAFTVGNALANVSAASFTGAQLASESIVTAFGTQLATATDIANSLPLPTTLAGTTVRVKDSAGTERLAPLFFVAPTQVNYLVPSGTANGLASIMISSSDGQVSLGAVQIAAVAPGLFTANASGQGVAAATVLRIKADGTQTFEPIGQFDQTRNQFVAVPIDLGPATDQVFILLFGTGFRNRSTLTAVSPRIGGVAAEVLFAGPQGDFVGLDQANLRIPRSLMGRGEVDVVMTVDGKSANTVKINIK
jgi:uncharacterized protein (TIGR03437 family)